MGCYINGIAGRIPGERTIRPTKPSGSVIWAGALNSWREIQTEALDERGFTGWPLLLRSCTAAPCERQQA